MCDRTFWQAESVVDHEYFCLFTKSFLRRQKLVNHEQKSTMSKIALFIHHNALPGRREDVRRIWEEYVKPRVTSNLDHEEYFFCYDESNPDAISVFQLYPDKEAMTTFLNGDWYPDYLKAISKVVATPPQITPASLVWQKHVSD
jgi:quinol monooxygenase YgiN